MARDLVVRIVGDSRSLEKSFARSEKAAKHFNTSMGRMSRGTIAASGAFSSLGRSIAFASGSFLGAAGLTAGIKSSINAAKDLTESVNAVQVVFGDASKTIERFASVSAKRAGLSMREFNQLVTPIGSLLQNTGDSAEEAADKSVILTRRAADMASVFNTDVATALEAIQSALRGEADPIERYGVKLNEAAVKGEAMRLGLAKTTGTVSESDKAMARYSLILKQTAKFQGDFANTSDSLANRIKIAQANMENLSAAIGQVLVPIITDLVEKFNAWISSAENQRAVLQNVKAVVETLGTVLGGLKDAFSALNKITGSTKETLKLLFAALVAIKTLQMFNALQGIATGLGLIGAEAATATRSAILLRGALMSLTGIGTIVVVVELILHREQVSNFFQKLRESIPGKAGKIAKRTPLPFSTIGGEDDAVQADFFAGGLRAVTAASRRVLQAAKEAAKVEKEVADAISKRNRAANEAFRQMVQDRAAFAVERATATETLADDLAALNKYNALLLRRIRGDHATLELEREQFQVQQQIADVLKQQAEKRAEQRETRQFRILGFGPGGADLVPTAATLRKQLGKAEQALQGTFLDTKKTRSLVARIRKVLADGVGGISEDVRRTIQGLIDDLRQMQDKSRIDLDRWQTAGRGQFVFAATGASRPINVNVQIDGKTVAKATARHNENEMGKRHKQRSHSRRTR